MAISRMQIEDPNYWRGINPDCCISENPWPQNVDEIAFSEAEIEKIRLSIAEEGYFLTPCCITDAQLEKLLSCTSRVMAKGHAPAYALLYDDFFEVLASLGNLLRAILGVDYMIVPDEPDVYFIPTSDTHAGAEPHRDTLHYAGMYDSAGLPAVINVWIPLTDATTLNSCMHVIPAWADPDYATTRSDETLSSPMDPSFLQRARALPAKAGSVLGWSTELIHWGGQSSSKAELPRLSFAMYFQRGHETKVHPTATRPPLNLDFDYRLYLVEKVWRDPHGRELQKYI